MAISPNITNSMQRTPSNDLIFSIILIYVLPCIIALGVFNNIVTILVMIKRDVNIGKRLKGYYIAIAIFDLLTVITGSLIINYMEDGLP